MITPGSERLKNQLQLDRSADLAKEDTVRIYCRPIFSFHTRRGVTQLLSRQITSLHTFRYHQKLGKKTRQSFFSLHRNTAQVVKRFISTSTGACHEIYTRLDPREYFKSRDIFIPKTIYTVKCEGTPNYPMHCGPPGAGMRCMTRMGNVEVTRIPRGIGQCFRRKREVITDVPVGCYCQ